MRPVKIVYPHFIPHSSSLLYLATEQFFYFLFLQEVAGSWPANQRDNTRVKGKKEVVAEAEQKRLTEGGTFCCSQIKCLLWLHV